MSEHKETSVFHIPKEHFAHLKEDSGFGEHIVKRLSSELAERIMSILEQEKEIIVSQSDLRVSEFMPTNSVEYRRQINWSHFVRCKDCKYYDITLCPSTLLPEWGGCKYHRIYMCADDFCSKGERREDEHWAD